MFNLYQAFWGNMFKFNKKSSVAEVVSSLIINIVIVAIVYVVGLFLAPTEMENLLVYVIWALLLVMGIGTLSSLFRLGAKG